MDSQTETVRYVWFATVLSIDEQFQTMGTYATGTLDAGGRPVYDNKKESLGWFVRVSNSSGLLFGSSKPDLKPGDHVRLTCEKV